MGVYEDRVFRAAARAQKRCGVPITTHIEPEDWHVCNIGLEQLALLMEEGADPTNTIIGHTFYATIDQLEAILKHGAYVQLDNVGTGWRGLDDDVAVASTSPSTSTLTLTSTSRSTSTERTTGTAMATST